MESLTSPVLSSLHQPASLSSTSVSSLFTLRAGCIFVFAVNRDATIGGLSGPPPAVDSAKKLTSCKGYAHLLTVATTAQAQVCKYNGRARSEKA